MLIQTEAERGALQPSVPEESILEQVQHAEILPFVIVVAIVILVLFVTHKLNAKADRSQQFARQLTMLGLSLVGLAAIVLALPLSDNLIQSLLSLIGLVLSAVVALSATTFMGNALAGIMLRTLKNFKVGDFVRSGEALWSRDRTRVDSHRDSDGRQRSDDAAESVLGHASTHDDSQHGNDRFGDCFAGLRRRSQSDRGVFVICGDESSAPRSFRANTRSRRFLGYVSHCRLLRGGQTSPDVAVSLAWLDDG